LLGKFRDSFEDTTLHEKELRIALVCFGGASLAVYMHGITKEFLKLTRASSTLHAITDREKRASAAFFDRHDAADAEYDTEAIYFDLLRDIGQSLELRIVIDIVAGASAGGINSTMLARALSHDLPMGRLRDLWLENADVVALLAPEARARSWSKWFLRPFFWAAGFTRLSVSDPEVRSKLSLFMRSRWFKPPLDGVKMAELMYDAVVAMGVPRDRGSSLLPSGQGLDLFVTVTDFYGRHQLMQIHDPPIIHEREYRHVLHFQYRRHASGAVESDFELANAPALAFAARATSSIPGAFPPAQILEVDHLVRARGGTWPHRSEFIAGNFEHYQQMNVDVTSVPFIDGSVLNSRPFREAIAAIRGRPAYREVDRRVVYIDPNPAPAGSTIHHSVPGFFLALKGALSDIPLAEPITDELTRIARINDRARRLRAIIESARPHISRLVAEVMDSGDDDGPVTHDRVKVWREKANVKAARDAGFAYEAYVRLKLASVRDFISHLIMNIRGVRPDSPFARVIAESIDAWAIQSGATYVPTDSQLLQAEAAAPASVSAKWVTFLLAFDVDYRKRRLRFLIEGQNRLYQRLGSPGLEGLEGEAVDGLKRRLYDHLEALDRREIAVYGDATSADLVEDIFRVAPSPAEIKEIGPYAQALAARNRAQLDRLVDRLGAVIDLGASTRDVDLLLADTQEWPRRGLQEVLVNYLGFPFWDVLTFPVLPWREAGEFNEIRVDRISARDARLMERLGTFSVKGTAFNQFAAFLSRAYRENDYLLGRLHALERLIDIVCDAAGSELIKSPDIQALKKRGFLRILDAEEPHLPTCSVMIAQLRAAVNSKGLF